MLQAQLNPHFLCNTLDTMKWISKINQVPQVALMSTNLADILRFCISPAEFVPLQRELEILRDTGGEVDIFVAGVGTGGTLTGVGEVLKAHNPAVRIVAVEPADSPVLSGGKSGPHGLAGLGAGFRPPILNTEVYDEVVPVRNDEAYGACRKIARDEALLLGMSSGAALFAATALARRAENREKAIVAVMPDTGERYLSTNLFWD